MQTRIRSLALAALAAAALVTPAFGLKGPPWISIELPVNPYDRSMQGAFLLVHAFHHGTAMGYIVSGTAEGIVGGSWAGSDAPSSSSSPRLRARGCTP